ncbi:MAG TPA: TonB-dependent receptor [Puia sp.]|nr:TonB-dependent receptor [Puia sp.]
MRKIKLLFLFFFPFLLATAQQKEVTGRVVDENGKPVAGASVIVKGHKGGTTTDDNGSFKITVDGNNTRLIISYVGFTSKEVPAAEATTVVLAAGKTTIDSVVVVGYGTMKKSDVTGSVASVKSSDLLSQPITNALEGLQGRVAGVDIALNSGAPGGLASVIIRGIGSINSSTDPLYVVDGVAMQNIQFLNPYDIQNVEVLKDASATSIYGARGSNGVILVTTKRGGNTKGTTVSYDASISAGRLAREIPVLNSTQWLGVLQGGMANNSIWGASPRTLDLSDTRLFNADGTPKYNTDWQKASTRTAVSNNHEIGIQTRNENSSTGVFMNYSYNQGIMLNSDLRRYNVRFTHDTKLAKWIDFGVNALVNSSKENEVDPTTGGNTPTRTMIEMPSIFPVKFPNGAWANNQVSSTFSFLDAAENPAKVLKEQTHLNTRTQIFGNIFLNFHITKDLDFKTQFGVDYQDMQYDYYSPSDLMNISANQKGVASITSEQYRYWQQENYLTYKKTFGIHHINAIVGASWQERIDDSLTGSTQYFADDYYRQYNLGAGAQPNSPASTYNRWSINSYFARVGYTLADKYLLTLTERIDGSSRFGANNKYGYFPSVGAGWILSKENFMQNIPAINYLKLRASYGQTGNTEIGSYQSLATVASGTTLLNGSRAGSSYINGLPNPDLKWEKTAQTDAGFEMQLFNSRVLLEADYYYKKTTNLLLNKPIPQSTGFSGVLSNIGSLSNQGVDLSLTTRNIEGKNFSWTTTFTANYNKNKILSLGNNNEDIFPGPFWGPVSDGFTILRVGKAMGSFWGYKRLGTWSTADVAAGLAQDPSFPYKAGEEKESTDKQILGKNTPDWNGSFVNTFRYRNFDLMVDLQFSEGADIAQAFLFSSEDRTGYSNSLTTVLNAWTPTHQNTPIQQLRFAPDAGQSANFDSHWVANGSFIRGRNVVLGYNLDKEGLGRLKIRRFRFYISAQNLFLIKSSSYHGYDPQSVSWNTPGAPPFGQNIEFYQYPKARTFTAGVNMSF